MVWPAVLIVSAVLLLIAPFIDYMSVGGYALLVVIYTFGFLGLVISSAGLTVRRLNLEKVLALTASLMWFIGWSWQFHFGLAFYVPVGFWGIVASSAYLGLFVVSLVNRDWWRVAMTFSLMAGSLSTTVVALVYPIYSPRFLFVPLAGGMILAGVLEVIRHQWDRKVLVHS